MVWNICGRKELGVHCTEIVCIFFVLSFYRFLSAMIARRPYLGTRLSLAANLNLTTFVFDLFPEVARTCKPRTSVREKKILENV